MNDATVKTVTLHRATGNGQAKARTLSIRVLRYNPQEPASVPHLQTYRLEEADGMTLFIALNEIREKPSTEARPYTSHLIHRRFAYRSA